MVKKAYIIAGIALVLVLLLSAVVVYDKSLLAGTSPTPTQSAPVNTDIANNSTTITALQAFSVAENSAIVKSWKSDKTNVKVSDLASQFCDSGLSDVWTIAYTSDTEDVTLDVNGSTVKLASTTKRTADMAPAQNIAVSGLIDTNSACDAASGVVNNAGMEITGPASIKLITGDTGAYIWDISYPVDGGYYIVRVDAISGKISQSALVKPQG